MLCMALYLAVHVVVHGRSVRSTVGCAMGAAGAVGPGKHEHRHITRERYDLLVAAYREQPGNASHAARTVKCDRRTATRAWHKGWPKIAWARPIRAVIYEESQEARQAHAEQRLHEREVDQERRDKERAEAIEAKKQELAMLKLGRSNVINVGMSIAHLSTNIRGLAEAHIQALAEEIRAVQADPKSAKTGKFVELLARYTRLCKDYTQMARTVIVTERVRTGQLDPFKPLADGSEDLGPLTDEEAVETFKATQAALKRAADLGLTVYEGGSMPEPYVSPGAAEPEALPENEEPEE